jgi:hypothetical protein
MSKELNFVFNLIQVINVSCSCVSCEVKSRPKRHTPVRQFQLSPPEEATEKGSELIIFRSDTVGAVCSNDEWNLRQI